MRTKLIAGLCIGLTSLAGQAGSAADAAEDLKAAASKMPLWEFGMGVAAVDFADYRGADTSRALPVPLPYFVYRGYFLRSDRDGLRGRLLNQDTVELNISVSATTPVRSKNSTERYAMPDLKPTFELGPVLNVHLWRRTDRRIRLDLRLAIRNAFTVESHPRSIGWFAAPNLNLDVDNVAITPGLSLGLLAGPLFAGRRYNEYFYTVAPDFATLARPAYKARGGYAGTQVLASLSKRFPRYWVGAFIRCDALNGAVFADSPLVHTKGYWAAGIGIAWMIGQSKRMIESVGEDP